MHILKPICLSILYLTSTLALPTPLSSSTQQSEPQSGQSSYYSTYRNTTNAYPANKTETIILPTSTNNPGPDDLLFQNLLAAEWVIYSFYQQGVSIFNNTSFTFLGYPNTTYTRLLEIRDNEAGHLKNFQEQISDASVKPGRCEYDFGFTSVESYLEILTILEVSSMAFLTGLVQEAMLDMSKGALVAIAETESRHNTWSLIDIWKANPFGGPSDTVFPYANQIFDITNLFVIAGSCPEQNPPYPSPNQHLPALSYIPTTSSLSPFPSPPGSGDEITFSFPDPANQPSFVQGEEYYAVFFHALYNISVPFNISTNTSKIPENIETGKGVTIVVLADQMEARGLESVVAGPLILMEQMGVSAAV